MDACAVLTKTKQWQNIHTHIPTYLHTYTRSHTRTHTHTRISRTLSSPYIHTITSEGVYTYIQTLHTHSQTRVCVYMHTYIHMYVCIHICGHARTREKEGSASPLAAGGHWGSVSTESLVNSMASVRTSSLHWVSSRTVFECICVCVCMCMCVCVCACLLHTERQRARARARERGLAQE